LGTDDSSAWVPGDEGSGGTGRTLGEQTAAVGNSPCDPDLRRPSGRHP